MLYTIGRRDEYEAKARLGPVIKHGPREGYLGGGAWLSLGDAVRDAKAMTAQDGHERLILVLDAEIHDTYQVAGEALRRLKRNARVRPLDDAVDKVPDRLREDGAGEKEPA